MTKIIFTGTSTGFAEKGRFHSQFLLKSSNYNLLFDAGDCTVQALFSAGIDFNEINGIIISHFHPDHISGLASLIQQMKLTKRTKSLDIFINRELKEQLIKYLALTYIFVDKTEFEIRIKAFDEKRSFNVSSEIKIKAFRNNHINNRHNVDLQDVKFASNSFFIETESGNIIFTADLNNENELFLFPQNNVKFYISELTHIDFSALEKVLKIFNPEKLIITHYDLAKKRKIAVDNAKILFANDGDEFELS